MALQWSGVNGTQGSFAGQTGLGADFCFSWWAKPTDGTPDQYWWGGPAYILYGFVNNTFELLDNGPVTGTDPRPPSDLVCTPDGNWHHFIYNKRTDGTFQGWKDDTKIFEVTGYTTNVGSGNWSISGVGSNCSRGHHAGIMAFSKSFSDAEIATGILKKRWVGDESGLVFFYPLDEGQGNNIYCNGNLPDIWVKHADVAWTSDPTEFTWWLTPRVIRPYPGEVITNQSSVSLQWRATGSSDTYDLEYSDDEEQNWTGIATNISGSLSGNIVSYTWNAGTLTGRIRVRVRISGAATWRRSDTFFIRTNGTAHFTDFSGYAIASGAPTGWTDLAGSDQWGIVATPDPAWTPSDRCLSLSPLDNNHRTLLWTSKDKGDDVDIIASQRHPATSGVLVARCVEELVEPPDSYGLDTGVNLLTMKDWLNGSTIDSDAAFTWTNRWFNYRFQLLGTALKGKSWRVDREEPTAWINSVTNSAITTENYVGVRTARSINPPVYYGRFAVDGVGTGFVAPNISASQTGATQVTVTMTSHDPSATDHSIYRSGTSGFTPGAGNLLASGLGAAPASYVDNTVVSGTQYYYKVTATNGVLTATSNESGVLTSGAPTAPTNLVATAVNATTVDLTWEDNSNAETSYEVHRSQFNGFTPGAATLVDTIAANSEDYTDTTIPGAGVYYYLVVAVGPGGSSQSNQASVTTSDPLPEAPVISADDLTETHIRLTITPGLHATSHNIYRSTTPGFTPGAGNLIATVGVVSIYDDFTVSGGTTYYYIVRAINSAGTADSNEASATTGWGTPPFLFYTDLQPTTVSLATDQPSGILETEYEVTLATDPTFASSFHLFSDTNSASMFAHLVTGLTSGVAYLARARRRVTGGWSTYSNILSFTTPTVVVVNPPLVFNFGGFWAPFFGEPIAGTAVPVSWSFVGNEPHALWISDDLGASWSLVEAGITTHATTFDSTAYPDGNDYLFQIRDSLDQVVALHHGFKIENGLASTYFTWNPAEFISFPAPPDYSKWMKLFATTGSVPSLYFGGDIWKSNWNGHATFGTHADTALVRTLATPYLDPFGINPATGVAFDITARFAIGGGEGGFVWARYWDTELVEAGVIAAGKGLFGQNLLTPPRTGEVAAMKAAVRTGFSSPLGDCWTAGRVNAELRVSVEPGGSTVLAGSSDFRSAIANFPLGNIYVTRRACGRYFAWYSIRFRATIPNPNVPTTIRLQAAVFGPGILPSGSYWQIDEEVDITPLPFECGYAGYYSFSSYTANSGWRAFELLGTTNLSPVGACSLPVSPFPCPNTVPVSPPCVPTTGTQLTDFRLTNPVNQPTTQNVFVGPNRGFTVFTKSGTL